MVTASPNATKGLGAHDRAIVATLHMLYDHHQPDYHALIDIMTGRGPTNLDDVPALLCSNNLVVTADGGGVKVADDVLPLLEKFNRGSF